MAPTAELNIRCFCRRRDGARVEELERRCEAAPAGKAPSFLLQVDTMGDPLCRVRNSPLRKMLVNPLALYSFCSLALPFSPSSLFLIRSMRPQVAELEGELVGVVRGSIKDMTIRSTPEEHAKVGYVLGLRVSPFHRRRGVASSLVLKLEEWFVDNVVDYAYMATEKANSASIKLFKDKLGYVKFRTPSILVNPVRRRAVRLPSSLQITKLNTEQAERLYRRSMGSTEFFPRDIDEVLKNRLTLGTWMSYPREQEAAMREGGMDPDRSTPTSWAMLSVWNSGQVFKLRVRRAKAACILYGKTSSFLGQFLPCLGIPALPDLSSTDPFGFYFMYGIHGEGPDSAPLVRALCKYVHNLATAVVDDCRVVVAEVGGFDALRHHVPHWRSLSCTEDLWCVKDLRSKDKAAAGFDWTKSPPQGALFTDPREV